LADTEKNYDITTTSSITMKSVLIIILHLALCNSIVLCAEAPGTVLASVVGKALAPAAPKLDSAKNAATNSTEKSVKEKEDKPIDITYMSMNGILSARGFESQVHYAITKDGYYVHLVRVINPLLGEEKPPKRPVVFNHGLMESGAIWLINSKGVKPESKSYLCESLPIDSGMAKNQSDFLNGPMLLSNYGYDVWLMSMRGTDFSLYHKKLDTSAPAFWDYSLDNFALGDIPAVINYVRRYTGHKKVAYVGHSQATFSVFALLSSRPQYANTIEPVFAVAPVTYMNHITTLSRPGFLKELDTPNLLAPMPESPRQIRAAFAQFCGKDSHIPFKVFCGLIDPAVGGKGEGSLKDYLSFFPYSTSHKVLRHFGQMINSGKMQMYDHGPDENLKRYGAREAPVYKIGNIRSKSINLIRTKTDSFTDPRDVDRFKSELTVPLYRDIFIEREFSHFDLITAEDARHLVFAPILEVLEEFEQRDGVCRDDNYSSQQADDNNRLDYSN
jgi:lysosomal acid lipase/cholesteryl ester hydrolase